MTALALLNPITGKPLHRISEYVLSDGLQHWPIVDGIAYLRADRNDVRRHVLEALERGDDVTARALLLTDQDPFAPLAPPTIETTRALVDHVNARRISLREAMRMLNFGPVADYFAHRTSTPTFLSGLGLLAQFGRPPSVVLELACGIGQFLRELSIRDVASAGVDVVFAKLWLAKKFIAPDVELVCGDAARPPVTTPSGTTVFCHDAFYFLPDKRLAAESFMRLAGDRGKVLIGHAHNVVVDHGVAGTPLRPNEYAALFPNSSLYDDAEFAKGALHQTPATRYLPSALMNAEAISIAWSAHGPLRDAWWDDVLIPVPGIALQPNPLLRERNGQLEPEWPSPRFALEYRTATYLRTPALPPRLKALAREGSRRHPEIDALARRRVLVDLPPQW
ncbi:MAG TPA: class I SAM-dependent methyltransferase [Burkholderiaceae bacterium]|nr:class I SAM-dependent methyltransferase [Burkholderiaceae bacterium]